MSLYNKSTRLCFWPGSISNQNGDVRSRQSETKPDFMPFSLLHFLIPVLYTYLWYLGSQDELRAKLKLLDENEEGRFARSCICYSIPDLMLDIKFGFSVSLQDLPYSCK